MRKKLIVLLVSTLLSVTFITSSAFAAHDNPKGELCDNTYTNYEHVGFHSSYSIYPSTVKFYEDTFVYLRNPFQLRTFI